MTRVDELPSEVLLNVCRQLREGSSEDVGDKDQASIQINAQTTATSYRQLALTNRSLCPPARESLFKSIVLGYPPPSPNPFHTTHNGVSNLAFHSVTRIMSMSAANTPLSPIDFLLRTLLENQEYGTKIEDMTLFLPNLFTAHCDNYYLFQEEPRSSRAQALSTMLGEVARYITTFDLLPSEEYTWISALQNDYPYSLVGVLLSLAPNLKRLSIFILPESERRKPFTIAYPNGRPISYLVKFFGCSPTTISTNIAATRALQNLHWLKFDGCSLGIDMHGLQYCPKLTHLALVPRARERVDFPRDWNPPTCDTEFLATQKRSLANITYLRINFSSLGTQAHTWADPWSPPQVQFLSLFPKLAHLDANATITYKKIFAANPHLYDNLETLRLDSPNLRLINPILVLPAFTFVSKLTVPHIAVHTPRSRMFVELPPSIQYLRLLDARDDAFKYLERVLQDRLVGEYEDLRKFEVVFRKSIPKSRVNAMKNRTVRRDVSFWTAVVASGIEVSVE
ncbi:hypothetical protein P280DRAFT_502898 [Massarina eburnea CBS 473.64]|uniref:Uncharacterized protein n=1 Tax=Massarina eburnea CBS 473.64 TaxID=1395130 RepID=A0A6A6SFF8_9PLEO|nr:hypothetical protein P280DRAFT_502898 [Massarina eburnea CBS 473.64]